MIIINKNKGNLHRIYFPKSINTNESLLRLRLTNGHEEYYMDVINEMNNYTHFIFTVDIHNIPIGEYIGEVIGKCNLHKGVDVYDKLVGRTLMRIQDNSDFDKEVYINDKVVYYED